MDSMHLLTHPVDHMRLGFTSFSHEKTDKNLSRMALEGDKQSWNLKLDSAKRAYGTHMAMDLATKKAIHSRQMRLPGLPQSNIHLETVLGTDTKMEFSDYLNDPMTRPTIPKLDIHGQMEVKYGLN